MIKKIIKLFLNPWIIIKKIHILFEKKRYNENIFLDKQNKIFSELNLSRKEGYENYQKIISNYAFLSDEMSSEHQVFFSSLSISEDFDIKDILEIGTWDAKNAFLLSLLFKSSNIDTIDLKKDHEVFTDFYNRSHKLDKFIRGRDEIIQKEKRINFQELNSLRLYNHQKKYDLIWIDGAHGYPVVCMDIVNSLKLLNSNGVIMCDDVFINKIKSDRIYQSTATFETLQELKNENIIDYKLIYKRLNKENNFSEKNRKYVAVVSLK